jgi:serine/threonine protein kinase
LTARGACGFALACRRKRLKDCSDSADYSDMEPVPRVPGYELIQPLGGGPFTSVWAALDAGGGKVAVKIPRNESRYSQAARILLHREALAGSSVAHPHLVRIVEDHTEQSPQFLVMDWMPGESLRTRLQREYRLGMSSALWIARQIAEALAALHSAGFVHGDVKPENVFLTDSKTAMLIDLGFAHRPGENERFLKSGLILGTANYLAPEVCDLNPKTDARADLFSLGVMLFELLTGRLPFPDVPMAETLRMHREDRPDLPAEIGPPALRRLLRRLLARHPLNRPRSAELIRELTDLEIASLRSNAA